MFELFLKSFPEQDWMYANTYARWWASFVSYGDNNQNDTVVGAIRKRWKICTHGA